MYHQNSPRSNPSGNVRSSGYPQQQLPSMKPMGAEGHFGPEILTSSSSAQSIPSLRSYGQHPPTSRYDSPTSRYGAPPPAYVPVAGSSPSHGTMDMRGPFPGINISSPISKVPKPPAYHYKDHEGNYAASTQSRPARKGSPGPSPTSPPQSNLPPSSFQQGHHSASHYNQGPGTFSYPAASYYAPNIKRTEAASSLKGPTTPPSRHSAGFATQHSNHPTLNHPPPISTRRPVQSPDLDDMYDEEEEGLRHLHQYSHYHQDDDEDEDYKGDRSGGGGGSKKRKNRGGFGSGHGEIGEAMRVWGSGQRRGHMEKAREDAKRRRRGYEVVVVNDSTLCLGRAPDGVEEKFLGTSKCLSHWVLALNWILIHRTCCIHWSYSPTSTFFANSRYPPFFVT